MKNGCTVRLKELENSIAKSGRYYRQSSNLLLFQKAFGLSEDCTRKDQCTTLSVFSTSGSSFFVLTRNGAEKVNIENLLRGFVCITPSTNCPATRRSSSSKFASISISRFACPGAWLCGPRGNTPTGNSVFPISSCASCSARSTSLSKLWTRRGAGIELNYRYLTA